MFERHIHGLKEKLDLQICMASEMSQLEILWGGGGMYSITEATGMNKVISRETVESKEALEPIFNKNDIFITLCSAVKR